MEYRMSSQYRKALKEAETVADCQKAYEEEWDRKYKQYTKEMTKEEVERGDPFNRLICEEFDVVMKAENRAKEIVGHPTWNMIITPRT